MNELLHIYIELLKWDIAVMSQPWMYYWLLVPMMFFLPFFFVKWAVLTAPLWLPLGMRFITLARAGKPIAAAYVNNPPTPRIRWSR